MAKKYAVTKKHTYEGKPIYIRADTEEEAAVKWALKLKELQEGRIIKSSSMLFKDWAKECISTYKQSGKDSIARDRRILKNCVFPIIGDMRLKSIKSIDCQRVLQNMEAEEYAKYTIHQAHILMRFVFDKAIYNDLIIKSPAIGLNEPKKDDEVETRSLSDREEKIFLRVALNNPKFLVFLLTYYCGCRPDEARKSIGEDIVQMNGYNILHVRGTKSKKADRFVPIPPELYELIKDTPKEQNIAPNMAGNRHTKGSYYRAWNNLKREMNIAMGCKVYRNALIPPLPLAADIIPYTFRHTFCTNLQKQNVDIRAAQYLMGHSDIKLTANIYTHSGTHTIKNAAELLCGTKRRKVVHRKLKGATLGATFSADK